MDANAAEAVEAHVNGPIALVQGRVDADLEAHDARDRSICVDPGSREPDEARFGHGGRTGEELALRIEELELKQELSLGGPVLVAELLTPSRKVGTRAAGERNGRLLGQSSRPKVQLRDADVGSAGMSMSEAPRFSWLTMSKIPSVDSAEARATRVRPIRRCRAASLLLRNRGVRRLMDAVMEKSSQRLRAAAPEGHSPGQVSGLASTELLRSTAGRGQHAQLNGSPETSQDLEYALRVFQAGARACSP